MIFVITGPSGCGKSTLAGLVLHKVANLEFSVSHTTRIKRDSEEEGRDYYFVPGKEFEKMIKEKKFVEWAEVHGHCYGTSRKELEKKGALGDLLLDIDVQGAQQIKEKYKKAVFIFILPPSFAELKRRLQARGQESSASVQKRLDVAKKEIRHYSQFDFLVVNDNLDKAAAELESIVVSTRCRLKVRQKEVLPILRSFYEEKGGA